MSNAYPENLRYVVARLNGTSTNLFRLQTVNQTNAAQGGIIQVNLPTNSIINMRSLTMAFTGTPSKQNAGAGDFVGFPANISSVIDRVEVLCGGVSLQQGFVQWNTASNIKKRLMNKRNRQDTDDKCLMGSYPVDIAAADQPATQYMLDTWECGFLNELAPVFLDTSILPEITVRLYLANGNVMRCNNAKPPAMTAGFDLSNIYFTCEAVTVGDGIYDLSLQEQMSAAGFLEIAYKNYYSFTNSYTSAATGLTSSSRFSVASQSIDAVYSILRPSSGDDSYSSGNQQEITMNNVLGPDKVSKYFNTTSAGIGSWQYTVNNSFIPQYQETPLGALHLVSVAKQDSFDRDRGTLATASSQWLENYCVFCVRLCHAGQLQEIRKISGFDSRGVNAVMNFNTVGSASGVTPIDGNVEVYTLVETTATLRVGLGRSIEVIN